MDFKKFGNFNWIQLKWIQKIRIWIRHAQNESIFVHFNPFSFARYLSYFVNMDGIINFL